MSDLKSKKTWAISTFFNPEKQQNKIKNYHFFRNNLKKQGVPLLTVECVFGDRNFDLKEADAEKMVQVRSNSILWQKERLLNIALKNLPTECENIVWVDADVVFLNDDWLLETEKLLDSYPIVQPFSHSFRLGRWGSWENIIKNCLTADVMREGFAYYYNKNKRQQKLVYQTDGGFAWAGKRYIFNDCGFYDLAIVGGADWLLNGAFIGLETSNIFWASNWSKKIQKYVNGDIYFTSGQLLHLYHGSFRDRLYDSRYLILEKNNYNPSRDLIINDDDCWEWSDEAPKSLKIEVADYFKKRNEGGKFVFSKNYFLENIAQISFWLKSVTPSFHRFLKRIF